MPLTAAVQMVPTPTAGDAKSSGSRNTETSNAHAGTSLTDFVREDGGKGRLLPTPVASSAKITRLRSAGRPPMTYLPTPTAQDAHNNGAPSQHQRHAMSLNATVGKLNPAWVEVLMGWPSGWTKLERATGPATGSEECPALSTASPAESQD